jgi:hypothetical protein
MANTHTDSMCACMGSCGFYLVASVLLTCSAPVAERVYLLGQPYSHMHTTKALTIMRRGGINTLLSLGAQYSTVKPP